MQRRFTEYISHVYWNVLQYEIENVFDFVVVSIDCNIASRMQKGVAPVIDFLNISAYIKNRLDIYTIII